jgi:hypothetical protein
MIRSDRNNIPSDVPCFVHGIALGKESKVFIRNVFGELKFQDAAGNDVTLEFSSDAATIATISSTTITATTVNAGTVNATTGNVETLELQGSASTLDLTFDDTGLLVGTDYATISDGTTASYTVPIVAGADVDLVTVAVSINGVTHNLVTSAVAP